jgi:hypothetical protein
MALVRQCAVQYIPSPGNVSILERQPVDVWARSSGATGLKERWEPSLPKDLVRSQNVKRVSSLRSGPSLSRATIVNLPGCMHIHLVLAAEAHWVVGCRVSGVGCRVPGAPPLGVMAEKKLLSNKSTLLLSAASDASSHRAKKKLTMRALQGRASAGHHLAPRATNTKSFHKPCGRNCSFSGDRAFKRVSGRL